MSIPRMEDVTVLLEEWLSNTGTGTGTTTVYLHFIKILERYEVFEYL
jgi:hypothetical protein